MASHTRVSTFVSDTSVAGDNGWLITHLSSPVGNLTTGWTPGEVSIGFDRLDAATVEVVINVDGTQHKETTTETDEVKITLASTPAAPASYLILHRNASGDLLAANAGFIGAGSGLPGPIG